MTIAVECSNALSFTADILILKHAQALYGVDEAVVRQLEASGEKIAHFLPRAGEIHIFPSYGQLGVNFVLFIGVEKLRNFDYQGIREFSKRALSSLAEQVPETRHICLTLHGIGYGLDESEAFKAEIAGLLDAIASNNFPKSLKQITIVERNIRRAERLSQLLTQLLPQGLVRISTTGYPASTSTAARQALNDVGWNSQKKAHVFVAMPFAPQFDDHFHYGIQGAVNAAGYLCERADLATFTGDVMAWVKERIASASLLIADLSTANPNVYLEVGYAWGRDIPTVLVVRDTTELRFDVRGQRCLVYKSIRHLEELLRQELEALRK
ncbi:hypothetical protein BZZ01_28255 [Nostocales cyanobacterium HT-58-2]|nr:hypothetical protein BZZ01_28255 [Nostocales cyanobacterium HT-58-2]